MATGLVHAALPANLLPARAQSGAQSGAPPAGALPPAVADMRDAILEAVQSGRLEDLKIAADLNELKPEFAAHPVPDPIAFWRSRSADGTGRDLLTAIGVLFEGAYAVEPLGKDAENSRMFIWPAFAGKPLSTLSPADRVHFERLEPPANLAAMTNLDRYTGWRIVIGADGVWHSFRRSD